MLSLTEISTSPCEISHLRRRRYSRPSPFQNPQERRAHFSMIAGGVWAHLSKPSAKPACSDGARCAVVGPHIAYCAVDFQQEGCAERRSVADRHQPLMVRTLLTSAV